MATYHAIRFIILNQQYSIAFISDDLLHHLRHGLEIIVYLSGHVLIPIFAQIALVVGVKNSRER